MQLQEDGLKMLVYGQSGIGKTVFLGTAVDDPRTTPCLMIDFEGGIKSILSRVKTITIEEIDDVSTQVINRIRVKSWADYNEVLIYLYNSWENGECPYKAILFDSLTETHYLCLQNIVQTEAKKDSRRDKDLTQLQDYGKGSVQMRRLVREFRDLPMHVFFTCTEQEVKDETNGKLSIKPNMVGKIANEIPALLDVVGYLTIDNESQEDDREMIFQPTGRINAKDRSEGGALGFSLKNATIPMILDRIYGTIQGEDN